MTEDNHHEQIATILEDVASTKEDVRDIKEMLNGNGKLGMVAKLQIVWKSWVWLLCSLSAASGVIGTLVISKIVNHV